MDASKLETFTLTIAKQSPTQLSVSLQAKVAADVPAGELLNVWAGLKAQLLGDPALAGFTLATDREDANVNPAKKTIQASLPCTKPAVKARA